MKSNNDEYKTYRKQYIACRILSYLLLIAPIAVLISVNFNKYFDFSTSGGTLKFSLSLIVAIFCLVLAIIQAVKKIEDKKYTLFLNAVYWLCAAFLSITFSNIFDDIGIICVCIAAGILMCASMNLVAENRKAWLESYRTGVVLEKTIKEKPVKVKGEETE